MKKLKCGKKSKRQKKIKKWKNGEVKKKGRKKE